MSVSAARHVGGRMRMLGVLTGVVLVLAVVALTVWAPWRSTVASSAAPDTALLGSLQRPVVSADGLAERSGVQITRVTISGGGGLVDLRFRVVDAERAAALHGKKTPAVVIDESTGAVVNHLLMNHSHSDPFKAGHTYYLIFENPGNLVRHGSRVTVLLGNAQVEHVVVP